MYIIVFILVLALVYVKTFEGDFEPEVIKKATPFTILIYALIILFLIF